MRFAYFHSGADLYGASRSLLRLTSRLVADSHQVLAVLPYEGPLSAALQAAGVKVSIESKLLLLSRAEFGSGLGKTRLMWRVPASVSRIRKTLVDFKPDIVHSNTATFFTPALAAALIRKPHIWHIREFFVDFPGLWPAFQRYMGMFSDKVICVSGPVREQFTASIRDRKAIVIHNGFPVSEFPPVSQSRIDEFKSRFGLHNKKIVGVVGRIKFKRKGQDLFVRAMAKIASRHSDAVFVCIGSPFPGNEDHLTRLLALAQELGLGEQFVYTGDIEDIQAAYAALDISVLSSAQPEPFGGVVIESMALGRAVVGTRMGGTVEQVEDGVTGFLVSPDDPEEMADAVDKLLSDPALRQRFGENGRKRFLDEFEFEPFYEKMLSVYSAVLMEMHE